MIMNQTILLFGIDEEGEKEEEHAERSESSEDSTSHGVIVAQHGGVLMAELNQGQLHWSLTVSATILRRFVASFVP